MEPMPQPPAGGSGDPVPALPTWLPGAPPPGAAAAPAPRKRRRRVRTAAVLLTVLLLVLALAAVVGDWVTRTAEADALLDQIERSEAAMISAMGTVSATMQQEDSYDGGLSDAAAEQLQGAADAAHREVILSADAMTAIAIQPWHGGVVAARDAYLEHSAAWRDFLARAELEPSGWFVEDPSISTTWEDFIAVLPGLIPTPAVPSLDDRVQAILDEGQGGDGSPGPDDTLQALG